MGYWDPMVTRLFSLGLDLDPEDLEVLEHGGEVAHLHHLLSPEWAGGYRMQLAYDQNQDLVYVPEILKVSAPDDPIEEGSTETVRQWFDREIGPDWRKWPTYIGVLDEEWHVPDRTVSWRGESKAFYRWWNSFPFGSHAEVEDLVEAAQRRINSSVYYEMERVFDYEERGDGLTDLSVWWAFKNDQTKRLSKADWLELERAVDLIDEDDDDLKEALEAFEICHVLGHLTGPNPTQEEYAALKPIFYQPMSEFLTPWLNRTWEQMLARREYIVGVVTAQMTDSELYRFDYEEEAE